MYLKRSVYRIGFFLYPNVCESESVYVFWLQARCTSCITVLIATEEESQKVCPAHGIGEPYGQERRGNKDT